MLMSESIYSADPPSYLQLISAITEKDINRLHHILQQEKFTEKHDIDRLVTINWRTDSSTALWYAFYYDASTAIIALLLEYGADLNRAVHCHDLIPVLSLACYNTDYEKIQLLLQYKANVHQCGLGQRTPIFSLCQVKYSEVGSSIEKKLSCFRLLLENGADVNHRDIRGETPLFKVCRHFSDKVSQSILSILRLLLEEYNADANIPSDSYQMTPLFQIIACTRTLTPQSLDVIRLLLQHNANVTIQATKLCCCDDGITGDTILHCVVRRDQIELVELILGEYYHPSLFTLRNIDEENVWDIARRLRHRSIVSYFQKKLRQECYKFLQQIWKKQRQLNDERKDDIISVTLSGHKRKSMVP